MPTAIRNFFIRIGAFLGQLLGISIQALRQLFGFITRISGLNNAASFDIGERESAVAATPPQQASEPVQNQTVTQVSSPSKKSPRRENSRSNTSGGNMDYFRNMARQIKTPQ